MATVPVVNKWHWVIEYLAELKDLSNFVLKDLIDRVPNFWYDIPEGTKERLYLRCLEQSLTDNPPNETSAARLSSMENFAVLHKEFSSEDILSRHLRKKEEALHDPENRGFEFQCNDLLFIQHKKSVLTKKHFDLIEESLLQGHFPENIVRHAEVEKEFGFTNAEFKTVQVGDCGTSDKLMPLVRKDSNYMSSADKLVTDDTYSKRAQPFKMQNNMGHSEELKFTKKPEKRFDDNQSCDPLSGYLREKGNKNSLNGGEITIPSMQFPVPGDGSACSRGGLVEDDALCVKCRKNGKLLRCNFCYITVHEGCLVSDSNLEEGCVFCCPWCSYRRAREEHDIAKELWSHAKEKFSKAKDALTSFIEFQVHHQNVQSVGGRRENSPDTVRKIPDGICHNSNTVDSHKDKKQVTADVRVDFCNSFDDEQNEADEPNTSPQISTIKEALQLENINKKKKRALSDENARESYQPEPISENQAMGNTSRVANKKCGRLVNQNSHAIPEARRNKLVWTPEEEEYLKSSIRKLNMKEGDNFHWGIILESGRSIFHETRKPDDLRIKWRNIQKKNGAELS